MCLKKIPLFTEDRHCLHDTAFKCCLEDHTFSIITAPVIPGMA